jgi:uridine kinase
VGSGTKPFLIGIAGGTGSGKTLLATSLAGRYAHLGVSILDLDSYYRDQRHLSEEERSLVNFDKAEAIDHDLLFQHLEKLMAGMPIEKPCYSFATHTRQPHHESVEARPMVILEGLFALWDSRIRSLMDLKVYVEADPDVRFIRRLRRDVLDRKRTVESVIGQYLQTVRPMHQLSVQPTRAYADIVVDNTDQFDPAISIVERAIRERRPLFAPRGEKKTGGD